MLIPRDIFEDKTRPADRMLTVFRLLGDSALDTIEGRFGTFARSGKVCVDRTAPRTHLGDFLSELRDFEDKLRRAANLHLEPDLNDGVALNLAPLWELVLFKDAKKYWKELMEGKYEWSSIGKQLREKGLVK